MEACFSDKNSYDRYVQGSHRRSLFQPEANSGEYRELRWHNGQRSSSRIQEALPLNVRRLRLSLRSKASAAWRTLSLQRSYRSVDSEFSHQRSLAVALA